MISTLCLRNLRYFSLDFSNLSPQITTAGSRNYKIPVSEPIDGYLSQKSKGDHLHTVIMIHEWWGFNNSMTKTAELLANDSIRVFVPDLYRGKPAIDAEDANHKMTGLDWPKALNDIKTIKSHFDKNSKSVSIMGFCMGGALTFASLSSMSGWKAGFPFYGIPDLSVFPLSKISCPVLAQFGRNDPLKGFSDANSAENVASQAAKNKYPIQVKIWDNVSHAFCNQDSRYFSEKTRNEAFKLVRQVIQS